MYQGCKVRLKSGGPIMTVMDDRDHFEPTVCWFDKDGIIKTATLPLNCLEQVYKLPKEEVVKKKKKKKVIKKK